MEDNKKINSGNSNGKPKRTLPKPPKFNFYWIYGILLVGILAFNIMYSGNSAKEISYQRFTNEMLLSHDVEKLIAFQQGNIYIVEIYLQKDKLQNEKYKDINTSKFLTGAGPHYYFTEASSSVSDLKEQLRELQKGFTPNEQINIQFIEKSNWGRDFLLTWILPLAIMAAIWIFIMRRISGGGSGPGGQIFNIGKSKATLFDEA